MARADRVIVMLESDIKEKFRNYAIRMGLTESALGAYILGQWIIQQEKTNDILNVVQGQLSDFVSSHIGKERE